MDFIKIPIYIQVASDESTVRDAIIRISEIKSVGVYISSEGDEYTTIIDKEGGFSARTPMSVAKIYDLIWQAELSNTIRHKDEN